MSVATTPTTRLPLGQLRTDGGTQIREQVDQRVVEEYTEQMAAEAEFPPVIVFDDGQHFWLADGFHRLAAAAGAEFADIACDVRPGSRRDAILYAVGANSSHGLRRSSQDKRRAVRLLLADDEWTKKSDRWIAERCGVSHSMVSYCRAQLSNFDSCHTGQSAENGKNSTRLGRDGKPRRASRKRKPTPDTLSLAAEPLPAAAAAPPSAAPPSAALATTDDGDSFLETDASGDESTLAIYLRAMTRLVKARDVMHRLDEAFQDDIATIDAISFKDRCGYERIIDDAIDMLWVACRNARDDSGHGFPPPSRANAR